MKTYLYYIASLFVLFLVQSSLIKVFSGSIYLVPQFLLLFSVIFAVRPDSTFREVLWMGMVAGFFLELFSGFFFGSYILAMALTALAVYFMSRKLTSLIFLVVLSSFLFVFWMYVYNLLVSVLGLIPVPRLPDFYQNKIFLTVLVNLAFFYPVSVIFKFLPHEKSIPIEKHN